jgi:hypothetical protein
MSDQPESSHVADAPEQPEQPESPLLVALRLHSSIWYIVHPFNSKMSISKKEETEIVNVQNDMQQQ